MVGEEWLENIDSAKRQTHNIIEKKRKDKLKLGIEEIRKVLPESIFSSKKETHHDVLQAACDYIQTLRRQHSDILKGNIDVVHAEIIEKLEKENREVKHQNKRYRDIIERAGFPPLSDLTQLVLSWKPRQSTLSVHCQTTITGSIESCTPPVELLSTQQPPQQKKKKCGQTINDCLRSRAAEMSETVGSDEMRTDAQTVVNTTVSTAAPNVLISNSETSCVSSFHDCPTVSRTNLVSTSLVSDTRTSIAVSSEYAVATQRQTTSLIGAGVKDGNISININQSENESLPRLFTAVSGIPQHSQIVSQSVCTAGNVSTATCYSNAVCCAHSSSRNDGNQALLLLPYSSPQYQTLLPTPALTACRLSERVASGTVLIDIGSDILGSGLVRGSFIYHGGRLVLGQQKQNCSPVWPLLPEFSQMPAPVYLFAGSRPPVSPPTNIYTISAPSDLLLSGLRVVCDGVSHAVDNNQVPTTSSDVDSQPITSTTEKRPVDNSTGDNRELGQPSTGTESNVSPELVNVAATDNPQRDDCDRDAARSDGPISTAGAVSADDSRCCGAAVTSGTADVQASLPALTNNEIVTLTSMAVITTSTGVSPTTLSDEIQLKLPPRTQDQVSSSSALAGRNIFSVTNASGGCITTSSSANVLCSNSSLVSASVLSTVDCSLSSQTASVNTTEIPAITKQARQRGTKRKICSQSLENSSKVKAGRMDAGKRISKYICPPPDSVNGGDSEIIHIMDRFCGRSLEQYLYPIDDNSISAASQHIDTGTFHTSHEGNVNMINELPDSDHRSCITAGIHSLGLNASTMKSGTLFSGSNHEYIHSSSQISSTPSSQKYLSADNLYDISSRADIAATSNRKGFALENFLSTTASGVTSNSLPQQSSMMDSAQMSKKSAVEKTSSAADADRVPIQSQSFALANRMPSSVMPCESASAMLTEELSLTDNDFAMILNDSDDTSMFISRKSFDTGYWNLGFGSTSGRLLDRTKDGSAPEIFYPCIEDVYHSVGSLFREPNSENEYVVTDHGNQGNKSCFNVSSLTCKTTSVCNAPLSTPVAHLCSNNSNTALRTAFSYSLISNHQPVLNTASPQDRLYGGDTSQASNVLCSTTQSSVRGIFSLAHHAVPPTSVPNSSCIATSSNSSESTQSGSILWSPCNGTSTMCKTSDSVVRGHGQSVNMPRQCRLPSAGVAEPAGFTPLYNSWSDNLINASYCAVEPLTRPRSFVGQPVNAQTGISNMQAVLNHPKLNPVAETGNEKFDGRWRDSEFCPFLGNRHKVMSEKDMQLNSQETSRQKMPVTITSKPAWTYSECGITSQPYLSTNRGWMHTNSSHASGASVSFDLNLPATSCLPTSACRLPSFSFATVPPVPDFLSLSFASTTAGVNSTTRTGSEVSSWPVTLTASYNVTSTRHGWSPIFPQRAGLQSHQSQATLASPVTVPTAQRHDSRMDVTYTVPSFIHAEKHAQKEQSSFKAHLPSYPLWHGTEHIPVEMCHLPPVSMVSSEPQLLPQPLNAIHGRGLYAPGNEAGFMTNTLTSPPLHHHPMYSNQQPGTYTAADKQLMLEAPFSLPKLPLTTQVPVLNFSSAQTAHSVSPETYHDSTFDISGMPVHMTTDEDSRQSHNHVQSRSIHRPNNVKRQSTKYPKHLKHNATSLCVGYPVSNSGCHPVAHDVPTYFPTGPFVGSCSFQHGLPVEFPKSLSVSVKTSSQMPVSLPNQRHNFAIGAFISELSSNSSQAVTAPAAIRRLNFPTPPVHVLQDPTSVSGQYLHQAECNQLTGSVSQHSSHQFALHNMSINSLLGDNHYTHTQPYSNNISQSTASLTPVDVPTLNFSIRSQTAAASFERPHNNKARQS